MANVTIGPVSLSERPAALHLAARGPGEIETRTQVASVLAAGAAGGDFVLLAAERVSGELLAAALAQVLAGRAAVVWAPQIASDVAADAGRALALELLAALNGQLAARGVQLAQFLASPGVFPSDDLWQAAGYQYAGELFYLAIPLAVAAATPPELPFTLEAAAADQPRLAAILTETYRGSLDCPLVDGLREPADVLAGYRTVGAHRPEWWLIARAGSEDVGCLILADHPAEDQAELVYLGIAPRWRGRGWGARLIEHARRLAAQAGRCRLALAVDAQNLPARAQYAAAGAIPWDARRIWIRDPRKSTSLDHETA